MPRTSIVIPVHDRRETTLRCLAQLDAAKTQLWADIIVVDDGSTDGTGDAIRRQFPAVTVLAGDGNLWWGGAIVLGMDHAMHAGADCLIWLNDDCLPDPGTLPLLADRAIATGGIATGWASTPAGGRYGAYRKTWRGLQEIPVPAPGEMAAAHAAAGNCVAVARGVVEAIGLPDARHLPHALLDVDYTLSATERGFVLELLGSARCRNEDNLQPAAQSWLLAETSPMLQWRLFQQPHSTYGYRASFRLHWNHWQVWGLWLYTRGYLKLAIICAVRAVMPLRWLRALFGARSSAYRRQQFHAEASIDRPPVESGPGSGAK